VEYILCAGGSDGTYDIAKEMLAGTDCVLLRQEPAEGKQRALRRCLAHSTGEVVYLTDADCVVDDEALTHLLAPILRGAPAATGRCRPMPEEVQARPDVLCQWAPKYFVQAQQGNVSTGLQGANCAVARDTLVRAGGFGDDVATGTDYHLAGKLMRAGATITFVPRSFVATASALSPSQYVRQQSRWLRNIWIHASRRGDWPDQLHAVQASFVGALILLLPLAGLVLTRLAFWPWLLLLLHGSLARMRYVAFLCVAEGILLPARAFAAAPYWFVVDAVAWVRSFVELAHPSRRARW
jgi:cellulose synthase/poly-beta-1,6-N-acetylglucosamine synthase-like glycosyltransferase